MRNNGLSLITYLSLLLSAVLTILSIFQDTGWKFNFELVFFLIIIFAISPYIFTYLIDVLLRRVYSITNMSWLLAVASFSMFFLTLTYFNSGGRKSSTDALKYLFLPFFLHIIWFTVFEIAIIWTLLGKLIRILKKHQFL